MAHCQSTPRKCVSPGYQPPALRCLPVWMESGSRRYGVLSVRIPQMIPDPNSHKVDGQIIFLKLRRPD
jgi:hypothetical protein